MLEQGLEKLAKRQNLVTATTDRKMWRSISAYNLTGNGTSRRALFILSKYFFPFLWVLCICCCVFVRFCFYQIHKYMFKYNTIFKHEVVSHRDRGCQRTGLVKINAHKTSVRTDNSLPGGFFKQL